MKRPYRKYNHPHANIIEVKNKTNVYLCSFNDIAIELIDSKSIVFDYRALTFRRASIFDASSIKLLNTCPCSITVKDITYESIAGSYLVEKESEDLFILTKQN